MNETLVTRAKVAPLDVGNPNTNVPLNRNLKKKTSLLAFNLFLTSAMGNMDSILEFKKTSS